MDIYYRPYGKAATIDFEVFEVDGVDLRKDATIGTADIFVMKDEGAEANATNAATDEGRGYSLVLTATEMTAKRIVLYIEDQSGTKVWLDKAICIETTRHPDAQHPEGVTEAGTAQGGAGSSITLRSGASADNDEYLGQLVTIVGGTGKNQSRPISSYNGTSKVATVVGSWATTPDSSSEYEITGDAITSITVPSSTDNANAVADLDISSKTTANTLGKRINDIFTDTDDMQPKIGTPALGTLASHLPTALSVGGYMKAAVFTINGRVIDGQGTEASIFFGASDEVAP